jgi:putative transposase
MKHQFIESHRESFAVGKMCKALKISRSGYYRRRKYGESRRAGENRYLVNQIETVFEDSKKTYGSPRVIVDLREKGIMCSENRVARLMHENGIAPKTKRKFKTTTNSHHELAIADDLLQRDFSSPEPNRKWASDITYLWTREGWLYLAAIMDIYNRKIVGWSVSTSLNTEIITSALSKALRDRKPQKGLIFHSDRGIQYASKSFRSVLTANDIVQSMSHKGDCYDNAIMESFFSTFKAEIRCFDPLKTRASAKLAIFHYIEIFYNRQRRHSALNYKSPVKFESST